MKSTSALFDVSYNKYFTIQIPLTLSIQRATMIYSWLQVSTPLTSSSLLLLLVLSTSVSTASYVFQKSVGCNTSCNLTIVESIPENLTYSPGSPMYTSTYHAWLALLAAATESVDIASYYWTLRETANATDVTDDQGADIFHQLCGLSGRHVKLRIVQNLSNKDFPNVDSYYLEKMGLADVQTINVPQLVGAGIMHTKLWVIDQRHFYVGSANMDWRALTQVKELGLLGMNCECLAQDAQRLFDVYWYLSRPGATIPNSWPSQFAPLFNMNSPAKINISSNPGSAFWSSSPPEFCVESRTTDLNALLRIINASEEFIYIAVMDYFPALIYEHPNKYWAVIDDALRSAAYNRGVSVRLMGSYWNHTDKDMVQFLASLSANSGTGTLNGSIETKFFTVPPVQNKDIPFTRVNHNKYMVTEKAAYVTTSNWSGDYFLFTGGVSCVVMEPHLQAQLVQVFMRDWDSPYASNVPSPCTSI